MGAAIGDQLGQAQVAQCERGRHSRASAARRSLSGGDLAVAVGDEQADRGGRIVCEAVLERLDCARHGACGRR